MTEEYQKAVAEVQKHAQTAVEKGRFFFAIYHIDLDDQGQPIIRMSRVTHDFPKADLEETVRMLERDVRGELGTEPVKPMATAAPQAPTINLFGGDQPPPMAERHPAPTEQPAATTQIEIHPPENPEP